MIHNGFHIVCFRLFEMTALIVPLTQPPSYYSVTGPLFISPLQSGKFGGAASDAQESQPQGIQSAEDAAEHENMKAVLKSIPQDGESGASTVPGVRTRTRASTIRGQSHEQIQQFE